MKKVLIIFLFVLAGVNIIITSYSNEILGSNLKDLKNIALADDETGDGFDCYSRMFYYPGYRTLECNTPCCYKVDYNSLQKGGKCTGHFEDC
jgi:hypothetical protein